MFLAQTHHKARSCARGSQKQTKWRKEVIRETPLPVCLLFLLWLLGGNLVVELNEQASTVIPWCRPARLPCGVRMPAPASR